MLFGTGKNLFHWVRKRRIRWVEYPLEPLVPHHPGRRLGGVHAQLVHVERHPAKRVLGPQLLDEGKKLFLVDGLRELHEQIEPIFLRDSHNASDGWGIEQSAVTFQRLTTQAPGTVEVSLSGEHYLVKVHDVVVVGIYPGQFLVAMDKFFLYPFGVAAFPDFTNLICLPLSCFQRTAS